MSVEDVMWRGTVWLMALVACGGPAEDDRGASPGETPDPTDTAVGTDDTGEAAVDDRPLLRPDAFGVFAAFFAVDDAGNAVPYDDVGSWGTLHRPVTLGILLQDSETGEGCFVELSEDRPVAPASWPAEAGAWWGFELSADAEVTLDTCQDYRLPLGWEDGAAAIVSRHRWGFAVGPMTAEHEASAASLWGSYWPGLEDAALGGGWYSSVLELSDGYQAGAGIFGGELDGSGATVRDADDSPVWIDAATAFPDGASAPVPGWYDGRGLYLVVGAHLLLQD